MDVAVGTPNRIARLAEGDMLNLAALQHVVVDVTPNAKEQTIFSPPSKGKDRQPDADELAHMLLTDAFTQRLRLKPPGCPQLCAVLLPNAAAIEARIPVGVRMQSRRRGCGRKTQRKHERGIRGSTKGGSTSGSLKKGGVSKQKSKRKE